MEIYLSDEKAIELDELFKMHQEHTEGYIQDIGGGIYEEGFWREARKKEKQTELTLLTCLSNRQQDIHDLVNQLDLPEKQRGNLLQTIAQHFKLERDLWAEQRSCLDRLYQALDQKDRVIRRVLKELGFLMEFVKILRIVIYGNGE